MNSRRNKRVGKKMDGRVHGGKTRKEGGHHNVNVTKTSWTCGLKTSGDTPLS